MQDIKPIQTYYNGYHFRSRLEARWQVFFDAMGEHAIYEHEGYERHFGDGEILRYLPDFYFPKYDLWGEVKGVDSLDKIPKDDAERISWFIDFNGVCKNGIILLGNIPEPNEYLDYAIWRWTGKGLEFGYTDDLSSHGLEVVQGVDSAPCHFEIDWRPTCSWGNKQKRTKVWTALEKARAARFEYGETPQLSNKVSSVKKCPLHEYVMTCEGCRHEHNQTCDLGVEIGWNGNFCIGLYPNYQI